MTATVALNGYAHSRIGQIHYVRAGVGPAVVLLPQSGRSARMFHELIPALAADHDVIALDVPGSGRSTPPPDERFTIPDLGSWLVEAIDDLGIDRFAIYGIHGGNKIGTAISVDEPDRVTGFVFAGRSHSIIPSTSRRNDVLEGRAAGENRRLAGSAVWRREFREITDIWWADETPASVASVDVRADLVIDSVQAFRWRPAFYRAVFDYDLGAALAEIAVPTMILEIATPTEDRTIGRQGDELLRTIPGSRLTHVEASDDAPVGLDDRGDEVAHIVRTFLAGVLGESP